MREAILIDNVLQTMHEIGNIAAWDQLLANPNRDVILLSTVRDEILGSSI